MAFLGISTVSLSGCVIFGVDFCAVFKDFIGEDYSGKMEYIVDTPKCKILKMSPWDEAILKFTVPKISPPDCKAVRHWTFLQENVH